MKAGAYDEFGCEVPESYPSDFAPLQYGANPDENANFGYNPPWDGSADAGMYSSYAPNVGDMSMTGMPGSSAMQGGMGGMG